MMEEKKLITPAHTRVALLIDADNVSAKHASELFKAVAAHGNVIVRKSYGEINNGFAWSKETVFKYAIETVARYSYVRGKNVADIALVIDAMELMRHDSVDVVCLASSDSDFSLLAMQLRKNGIKVYGFGEVKALSAFVASCDGFTYLGVGEKSQKGSVRTVKKVPEVPPKAAKEIKEILADACDNCSDDEGWANLAMVGGYLIRVNPAFSAKNYGGYKKLHDLVRDLEDFEVSHNSKTLTTKIRKRTT